MRVLYPVICGVLYNTDAEHVQLPLLCSYLMLKHAERQGAEALDGKQKTSIHLNQPVLLGGG